MGLASLPLAAAAIGCGSGRADGIPPPAYALNAEAIRDTIGRVADLQLGHPVSRDPRHWAMAPLYDGLIDASLATGDPRYLAAVLRTGRRVDFGPRSRTYHADDHAAGHAWLRLYLMSGKRDPALLVPFEEQFDEIVEHPVTDDLAFGRPPPPGRQVTDRWTWADALYMAPPTVTLLAYATGDDRYLDWMDQEFGFTHDRLYDREEHLFCRDARFVGQRTPGGEKVFWSRGNAWVYAGLALLLRAVPEDWPRRPFYEDLFREMSPALAEAQQRDGFWYPSLLDPSHVPAGEVSGTALFVMGMAFGVREGLLDGETYRPVVERGWNAIRSRIDADGAVSSVQGIGAAPQPFDPLAGETYGTGAVLMAGLEILRALDAAATDVEDPAALRALFEEARARSDAAPDLTTVCEGCADP